MYLSPQTVHLSGLVVGVAAPGPDGPLVATTYDGDNLSRTVPPIEGGVWRFRETGGSVPRVRRVTPVREVRRSGLGNPRQQQLRTLVFVAVQGSPSAIFRLVAIAGSSCQYAPLPRTSRPQVSSYGPANAPSGFGRSIFALSRAMSSSSRSVLLTTCA
ncbi:hypothetical protein [Amycolatopsis sp. NPDC003676]